MVGTGVSTTGHIVTTVKTCGLWEDEISPVLAQFAAKGAVCVLETTSPYSSMPGEAGTIPSVAVVIHKF